MNKIKILFLLTVILILNSCQNNSSEPNEEVKEKVKRELTEEELKQQLFEQECSEPTRYLGGSLNYKPRYKGILSVKVTGLKLECNLSNKATLATFKDLNLVIRLLSKTGSVIKESNVTVYEFIKPGGSITYKTEIDCTNQEYNDLSDLDWTIVSASCR